VLEVRHALFLALFPLNALGGFYGTAVGLQIAPWRSLAVGLCAGLALSLLLAGLGISRISEFPVSVPTIFLTFALARAVELWHHRTFVRGGELIVLSGILGTIRESFPISEVRDVQVSYPLWGHLWNVGDIDVLGYGWGTTLPAVRRPDEYAKKIVALRGAFAKKES
jgi:Bacterial PH domain